MSRMGADGSLLWTTQMGNLDVAENTGSPAFFAWMSTADGSLYDPIED